MKSNKCQRLKNKIQNYKICFFCFINQVVQDPVAAEANLNDKTFILSNGETFEITVDNDAFPSFSLLQSTGINNEGTWLEAKRTISFLVQKPFSDPFDDPDSFAKNWSVSEGSAAIKTTGPSDGEPALHLKGEKVTVSLNWVGNTDLPDLTEIRSQNDDLLSYE